MEEGILLFIGGGDVIKKLQKKVAELKITDKVFFIPKQPMEKLLAFTAMADIGLTLDKDSNLNYKYSLPNKLFDYIRAGLPVLATDLVEVKKIVEGYSIGKITPSLSTNDLAKTMNEMINDADSFAMWKENLKTAALELCWEKEEQKLFELFNHVI